MTDSPETWSQRHQAAYGEDAWSRVQRHAWTLTRRYIGWDSRDVDQVEGPDTAEESRERQQRWLPASGVLALALWRAARADDLLVDDVPLTRALWWAGGQKEDVLFDEPLPPLPRGPRIGGWEKYRRRRQLVDDAHAVATSNGLWHDAENRALAETDDGTEPPPLLLGDRVRAIESGPYRSPGSDRWHGDVEHAHRRLREAEDQPRSEISEGVLDAMHRIWPVLQAAPDSPPAPDHVDEHTWLQRLHRLERIRTAIQDVLREAEDPQLSADYPAGRALTAVVLALTPVQELVRDLGPLWDASAEEEGVAAWERAHMPVPVRRHIRALQEVVRDLGSLFRRLTAD